MRRQFLFGLTGFVILIVPAWATAPKPVLRYVFDASGTQKDLGTAPAADGTPTTSAAFVYNTPLSLSCRSLDLTAGACYVTTTTDVDKIDALPEMTATFWINMRSAPAANDCLLSDKPSGIPPAGQGGWELRIASSGTPTADNFKLDFSVMESLGGYTNAQGGPGASINAASQWVFVAVTYGSDFTRRFYTGAESTPPAQIGSTALFAIPLRPNSTEFRIGSATSEPTTDRTPPAYIDDVRIYDRALTLAELDQVRLSNLYSEATLEIPAFFGLRDLPGGSCASNPQGLSADGSTVIGWGVTANGIRGFRWRYDIMEPLVDPSSATMTTIAAGVSADGSVVVGERRPTGAYPEAFRWDSGGTGTPLGDLPGDRLYSTSYGVSGDGAITVGFGTPASGSSEAFQYASSMVPLGILPGDTASAAFGISRDGTVIVGGSGSTTFAQACYWQDGILTPLGDLDGGASNSIARKISADNQAIVGFGNSASGQEATLWQHGRIIGLGDLPENPFSSVAYGVSAKGSYIVGQANYGASAVQAFIWDRQHGMRSLKSVLETDYSLDLSGWNPTFAAGISDDGSVIAGGGANPVGLNEGWIARLPLPPVIADFNHDNSVDSQDAEMFAACTTGPNVPYGPGNLPPSCQMTIDVLGLLPADFDWDGDVDQDDFGEFQRCFAGTGGEIPPECRG